MSKNIKNLAKKRIFSIILVWGLIWGGFFCVLTFLPDYDINVSASTLHVGGAGPGNYSAIQVAINAANPGDTIYVWAGTYYENIMINKKLNLIGDGILNSTINGGGNGDVVYIYADSVKITGFTITNSGFQGSPNFDSGIELNNVKNVTIINNNVSFNNLYGILLINSDSNTVANNICDSNLNSNIIVGSDSNTIINNFCSNSWNGIYLSGSNSNYLFNNTCVNNSNGILIVGAYNIISNNTCNLNILDGIYSANSNQNRISNNTCDLNTNSGIKFYLSNNNIIENNICTNSSEGIYLQNSNSFKINNNTCTNNSFGIYQSYSDFNTITNNSCSNNEEGIYLDNSDFNNINNNTCLFHISTIFNCAGIYLDNSNDNNIANNTCNKNDLGIFFTNSDRNIILNNLALNNNDLGIVLHSNSTNYLSNNNCSYNGIDGILIDDSDNNILTNNFISYNNDDGITLVVSSNYNEFFMNKCVNNVQCGIVLAGASIYNNIRNNTCTFNGLDGIHLQESSTDNTIWENTCTNNSGDGIIISNSDSNTIISNDCSYNKDDGITLSYSDDVKILNNKASFNTEFGMVIRTTSSDNILSDNSCDKNGGSGIILQEGSNRNELDNNNCSKNSQTGIYLIDSTQNIIMNSKCFSNSINGIKLSNSPGNKILKSICNSNDWGILLINSPVNELIDNIFKSNNIIGISLTTSSNNNIIENCSTTLNSNHDILLKENSNDNIAINTTFNKISIANSKLIVKNYLHLQVNDINGAPLPDADAEVKDDNTVIYSTSGYGGLNTDTNTIGQIKWILVTDRVYEGSNTATEHTTTVNVKYSDMPFRNDNSEIDMSSSHFEYFYPNTLPDKITLTSPLDNDFLNDSTPELIWCTGSDLNNDSLTYYIEVDEFGDNWWVLADKTHTLPEVTSWDISVDLDDGTYQWRVCANDGFTNGPWSDVWTFTIDTDAPVANTPISPGVYNNTGTVNWTWEPSLDTGSGITGYYVCIGTTPGANNIVNDAWTINTWFEKSDLEDGKTYYCKIKAENGVGIIGDYSGESNGILIDTDKPTANTPIPPGEYTNTLIIKWEWQPSPDTGSGIIGYFVSIGTTRGGSNIIKNDFTTKTWYQASDLHDGNTYYCNIQAKNGAGTIGEYSNNSEGVTIDMSPPYQLSILINDAAIFTDSNLVTLKLNAVDKRSGVYQMAFSTDDKLWSNWEQYNTTSSYTLSSGDGVKIVYFKVKDYLDNIADSVSDTIILDTSNLTFDKDGDGYNDNLDAFPEDPTEWLDTDGDNIGNNADDDDDNDGIPDNDEDENHNGIVDESETDPLKWDTDGDGYSDGDDIYPLDSTKWEKKEDKSQDNNWLFLVIISIIFIIIIILTFLFLRKNKLKKKDEEESVEESPNINLKPAGPSIPPLTINSRYSQRSQQLPKQNVQQLQENEKTIGPLETEVPKLDIKALKIQHLLYEGNKAYDEGRHKDSIIAFQEVLFEEPDAHPDLEVLVKNAVNKIKQSESTNGSDLKLEDEE